MQEAKYTPGPWAADIHGNVMAYAGTTNVASTWTTPDVNYPDGRLYKANARLIAAAPELLDLLQRLCTYCDMNLVGITGERSEIMALARDVIIKAKGKYDTPWIPEAKVTGSEAV